MDHFIIYKNDNGVPVKTESFSLVYLSIFFVS